MSRPATNNDKSRPPGKQPFSFKHPFANTTRQDAARGVSGVVSVLGFIFWPLGLLYFILTLPIALWRQRHRFFPFGVRVGRGMFWNAMVIYLSLGGLLAAIIANVANRIVADTLFALLGLTVGSSAVAVGIGRLHDRDISGWWILLYYGAPFLIAVGLVIVQPAMDAIGAGEVIILYFMIWTLIALGFRRGTPGPNRFGPEVVRRASAPKPPA
jgi:uncharacterized membrane protein YhaH (DUF805 family)